MGDLDIEAIRMQIRAMDFTRGTLADIAEWREADENSRANLVIEDMIPTPNEDAFFAMMHDEGVPPPLATQILLRLLDHPDADPLLAVGPRHHGVTNAA